MSEGAKGSKECEEVLEELKRSADPGSIAGMARFGISVDGTMGVSMPALKGIAKRLGKNHELALKLWGSGVHEANILAALIADPKRTDRGMMESWVRDFDSWDVCDQVCNYLFSKAEPAYEVIPDWTSRELEFVKRAGFVMMAALAVHDKAAKDEVFLGFFPLIERQAGDGRNYVKKAASWAVRQMGKRNLNLREECIALSERIRLQGTPSARWIASDAIRELSSEMVISRLEDKESRASMRRRVPGR